MDLCSSYHHCPYDGQPLEEKYVSERMLGVCPRCGFVDYQNPKPCVAVMVVREGKILLALRGIEPAKGKWDIPGGFIEPGESAEQAAVREIFEETSLRVRIRAFLGSISDVYGERREPTLNLCFIAEILEGEPRPRSDVAKLAWFCPDQAPAAMAFDHQHRVLEWAVRSMKGH